MIIWHPDFLGPDYSAATLAVPADDQGPAVATLVRHNPPTQPTKKANFAFLAVHGWNDYFYQTELAEHITAHGGQFYALDLRRYGRSHRKGQLWGYISNLDDYDAELQQSVDAIKAEHGNDIPIILYGHSTGGLTTTLWANRKGHQLAGLVLNSPWLEYQDSIIAQTLGRAFVDTIAKFSPTHIFSSTDSGFYQRVLTGWKDEDGPMPPHQAGDPFFEGGWKPDKRFRHFPTFPARAGWLSAILAGHATIAQGLDMELPVLVLTSAHSEIVDQWQPHQRAVDGVLDVKLIWKRAANLSRHTTLVKLPGAIHDVMFSRAEVRHNAYHHLDTWIDTIACGQAN